MKSFIVTYFVWCITYTNLLQGGIFDWFKLNWFPPMVDEDKELGNQFSLSINTQTGLSGTSQKTTLYFTLSKSTQFVQMNRGGE